jgi:hypothetical protein
MWPSQPTSKELTVNATTTTKQVNQQAVYGCDIEDFVDNVFESITYQACGVNMVVSGLMSDAQEQMAHGDVEGARQTLNRAKYLMSQTMQGKLTAVRGI